MTTLNTKAWLGLSSLVGILGLLLFVPAGSLAYWQAWEWLILFSLSTGAITLDLMKSDPALLERRMRPGPSAEKETRQQVIQALATVAFLAIFLVSASDYRFGWSEVTLVAVVGGDLLLVVGLFLVFLVFRAISLPQPPLTWITRSG